MATFWGKSCLLGHMFSEVFVMFIYFSPAPQFKLFQTWTRLFWVLAPNQFFHIYSPSTIIFLKDVSCYKIQTLFGFIIATYRPLIVSTNYQLKTIIMITCPCNVHPLTPHLYIVKLWFTGVYTIFLCFL